MPERIGPVSALPRDADPRMAGVSDGMLDTVDDEVRRISDECYAEARRLLRENRARLDAIAAQLLEHETLDEPKIYAAAGSPRPAGPPAPAGAVAAPGNEPVSHTPASR
jgi:cell division protease FtsH